MSLAPKEIGNYVILGSLGSGNSAKVKLAEHKLTHQKVAIKLLKKENLKNKPRLFEKLQREIALMSLFEHPHILRLYEVFESDRHLHIVIEYAQNGELFDLFVQKKRIPEDEAMELFRQIIYALEYLHIHGICHRDLKPENILLDANNHIKIADFGFARWMKSGVAQTSCGSPHYAAPEVIRAQPYSGRMADIWSAGVILYAMLAGRLPFDDPQLRNLLMKIKKGEYFMPNFNPLIQDLIGKMIQIDVEQRITIDNIKKHPAFYLHLPQGYIVPVPLPLPHIDEPIDPDEIQPQLLKVLKQIGYKNDEELVEDLKSKGQTMAKVFHYMLTRQTDRSQLPWEKARHYDIEADMGKEEMLPEIPDAAEQNLDIRIRQSDMSPGVYSLAKKADWAIGDSIMVNYDQENVIESIHMTSAQLMSVLQQIMNELKYEWFHPDDLSLLARTPQCTYFEFTCMYSEIDIINLYIRMNLGTPDLLQELMAKINTALHLQVIDQNDQILDVVDDNNDIEIQNND